MIMSAKSLMKPWRLAEFYSRTVKCNLCGERYVSGFMHKCKIKPPPPPICKFKINTELVETIKATNKCLIDIYDLLRFKIKQE